MNDIKLIKLDQIEMIGMEWNWLESYNNSWQ